MWCRANSFLLWQSEFLSLPHTHVERTKPQRSLAADENVWIPPALLPWRADTWQSGMWKEEDNAESCCSAWKLWPRPHVLCYTLDLRCLPHSIDLHGIPEALVFPEADLVLFISVLHLFYFRTSPKSVLSMCSRFLYKAINFMAIRRKREIRLPGTFYTQKARGRLFWESVEIWGTTNLLLTSGCDKEGGGVEFFSHPITPNNNQSSLLIPMKIYHCSQKWQNSWY